MNAAEWEHLRSRFNHAWLKNRLIVATDKMVRVASGDVEDGSAVDSFGRILAQWPDQRTDAAGIIAEVGRRIAEPLVPQDHEHHSADIIAVIAEANRQRWIAANSPQRAMETALECMQKVDASVNAAAARMAAGLARQTTRSELIALRGHARSLAVAFSALSIPLGEEHVVLHRSRSG